MADAAYLKGTVNDALTEALSAMSVGAPEDRVEYIGRYLLQYVQRKSAQAKYMAESGEAESKYAAFECENDVKNSLEAVRAQEARAKVARLQEFVGSLSKSSTSKQEAMNQVSAFIAEYLSVQGAYIAVKRSVGESEALYYYSASPGQEFVVGKKLTKPVEEGDEVAPRQGLSFEAFKIPEVPEEAAPEEGEEAAPAKPPPRAQPLVVENCMREKRCKFFGIPKLGSYLAIPLTYSSVDHVEGCVMGMSEPPPADPDNPDAPPGISEPTYTANKVPLWMILGMDTVGEYRNFKAGEIETAVTVADVLAAVLQEIEGKMFESHVAFLVAHKAAADIIAAMLVALAADEASALENVAAELAPPAVDPDAAPPAEAPEPAHESLKPFYETAAVLKVWTSASGLGGEAYKSAFLSMQNHVLPAPASVCNLLFAVGCFLGLQSNSLKDVCGETTWELLRTVRTLT